MTDTTSRLPASWKLARLDAVADVRLGRQRSPKDHQGLNMRPYLRAANVTWRGVDLSDVLRMNFTDAEMETFRLLPGDILVNEASGSPSEVGKAAMYNGEIDDCAFQNTVIRVRPRTVSGQYLLHFLTHQAISGAYVRGARGVGINHIGVTSLAMTPTPLPPTQEQARIVETLEEQFSRLDAVLLVTERCRSRASQLRRSVLQSLLEEPDESVGQPSAWLRTTLGEVAEFLNGRAYKREELLPDGKYRVLRVGNFFSNKGWY